MTTTKPRDKRCVCAYPDASLSWSDLVSLLDGYGLLPETSALPQVGDDAEVLHRLHRDWVIRSGIYRDRRYVMPLRLAYAALLEEFAYLSRGRAGLEARRLLTDVLNDPDSGLRLTRQPSYTLRSAAS